MLHLIMSFNKNWRICMIKDKVALRWFILVTYQNMMLSLLYDDEEKYKIVNKLNKVGRITYKYGVYDFETLYDIIERISYKDLKKINKILEE